MSAPNPVIRCREIGPADLDVIADLLTRGFQGRRPSYWLKGLQRQATREIPEGYPRFGYMLDHGGRAVGVLLLIYTAHGDGTQIWCNLSSWYVEPAFRNFAPMLTKVAQRLKDVTYFNISAARGTWPIIEAQGFRSYCEGVVLSVPALSRAERGTYIEVVTADATAIDGLTREEAKLLIRHARYGCLSITVRSLHGTTPFVLQPFRIRRGLIPLPVMQLIYCRNTADYVAYAGTIGRFLLGRGKMAVLFDANGPVPDLIGVFTERRGRKYVKGPHRPRLGNLSDTELVLYGP
ncbi:conserved hypothetical protein [Bradyrhizobium sp. STM 3843]|uniref:acyl-CoA N-acyltransferase n=1 Tax=Bradyrhizobium sp. STM 3843 TaxID=551947 RepID=UPI0002407C12|nr:acyl-CoA N-acyltransferase [Bradyrhizobium sp. STM 3843]CCE07471.1 conserved hypothetical protein [Bradyrhizobium sp. STM 3843]